MKLVTPLIFILLLGLVTAQPYALFTVYNTRQCTIYRDDHNSHYSYYYPADNTCFMVTDDLSYNPESLGRKVTYNETHVLVFNYLDVDCKTKPKPVIVYRRDKCVKGLVVSLTDTKPDVHYDNPRNRPTYYYPKEFHELPFLVQLLLHIIEHLYENGIILPTYMMCIWSFCMHSYRWKAVLNKVWRLKKEKDEDIIVPPIPRTKYEAWKLGQIDEKIRKLESTGVNELTFALLEEAGKILETPGLSTKDVHAIQEFLQKEDQSRGKNWRFENILSVTNVMAILSVFGIAVALKPYVPWMMRLLKDIGLLELLMWILWDIVPYVLSLVFIVHGDRVPKTGYYWTLLGCVILYPVIIEHHWSLFYLTAAFFPLSLKNNSRILSFLTTINLFFFLTHYVTWLQASYAILLAFVVLRIVSPVRGSELYGLPSASVAGVIFAATVAQPGGEVLSFGLALLVILIVGRAVKAHFMVAIALGHGFIFLLHQALRNFNLALLIGSAGIFLFTRVMYWKPQWQLIIFGHKVMHHEVGATA